MSAHPSPRRTSAVVRRIAELTARVRVLELSIEGPAFVWSAGQHLEVIFEGSSGAVRRPYSIACAHDAGAPERIELAIACQPGGQASSLVEKLATGDRLEVEGPFGGFPRMPDAERSLVLIAGGTGYAPLRALLQVELSRDPNRRAHLLLGSGTLEDVPWVSELDGGLGPRVGSTLTLLEPPSAWSGAQGRVDRHLPAIVAAHPSADYFVCGPRAMLTAVCAALARAGVGADRVVLPTAASAAA